MSSVAPVTIRVEDLRPSGVLSIRTETMVSISEMDEVSAANSTSRKNTAPMISPNAMDSNTMGSVLNIRPGPLLILVGSPPLNATTGGMIIRPATKANSVSNTSIWVTECSMMFSRCM